MLSMKKESTKKPLRYNEHVEHQHRTYEEILEGHCIALSVRWTAIKIVEGDSKIMDRLEESGVGESSISKIKDFYKFHSKDSFELDIIDSRYAFAHKAAENTVIRPEKETVTLTDKLDKMFTNKYLGIPAFAAVMLIVSS